MATLLFFQLCERRKALKTQNTPNNKILVQDRSSFHTIEKPGQPQGIAPTDGL